MLSSSFSCAARISKIRTTFPGVILLILAFCLFPASRGEADTLYRNTFDDAGSLAGLGSNGTVTVSAGQFLSADGVKSNAYLDLSTISGYNPILENNTEVVTIGFNLSVDDVNTLNGGFFLDLSDSPDRASSIFSDGYFFAGGGYTANRTVFGYSGGAGVSDFLIDITNGIPDLPQKGSVKIEYDPATDNWTLYMRIGSDYVDPLSLTESDKVGEAVNSLFAGTSLRYLVWGATSLYDDIYFDNLTVSVGAPDVPPVDPTYFDITFEEAKHVVGQAPAIGGTDSPSVIFEGSPEVINFGGSKVLKFNAPLTSGQDSSNESIILNVAKEVESYTLEYDLYTDNLVLPPSGVSGESFSTNVWDNANQQFFFQPLGGTQYLRYFQSSPSHPNPPAISGNIGNYVHDQWYHVKIEVDTVAKTWVITVDGDEKLNGPIYLDSDVDQIRFRLTDRDGAGDAVLYMDNIKVSGPPPPLPPEAPTGVTATDRSHSDKVVVNWTPVTGATGNRIYRNTMDDSSGASEIGSVGDVGSYDDTSAVAGTMYYYWVKAENGAGLSEFSGSDAGIRLAPPIQVTGVAASDGTFASQISLTWVLTPFTGTYRIYRGTTSSFGSASNIHNINSLTIDTWNDTSAVSGQTYYYWVRSANSAGNGPLSDPDTGFLQTAPDAPANVSASDGISPTQTTIVWDATLDTTSYRVFRGTVNDSASASILTVTTDTFLNDTSGTAGQIYYYWIRSVNDAGAGPFSASDSGFKLAPPLATVGLTATDSTSFNQVSLNWTPTALADSYRIFRSTTDNPGVAVEIGTSSTADFVDFTAVPGQTYFYWVRGENAAGESTFGISEAGQRSVATPDLHIGRNAIFKIGDDVYSETGADQRIRQLSKKGRKLYYYFSLQNDGTVTDTLTLRGTPGNSLLGALYRDATGANVTSAVVTGTFQENLDPAGDTLLRLEVRPGKSAIGKRKRRIFVMRGVSTEDPAKSDAVQALAETKKERKKKKRKKNR